MTGHKASGQDGANNCARCGLGPFAQAVRPCIPSATLEVGQDA
jgi:hypothetical protein